MKTLILVSLLLGSTAFAGPGDVGSVSLRKASRSLGKIAYGAAMVKKLAESGDEKGACIVARDNQAYGFGYEAESYQLDSDKLQNRILLRTNGRLAMDVGQEENKLHCRIQMIQSFCAESYGWNAADERNRLNRDEGCAEELDLKVPTSLTDMGYQALILSKEAERLQTMIDNK